MYKYQYRYVFATIIIFANKIHQHWQWFDARKNVCVQCTIRTMKRYNHSAYKSAPGTSTVYTRIFSYSNELTCL